MINLSSRKRELLIALGRNAAVLFSYLVVSAIMLPVSAAHDSAVLFSAAGVALGALLLFGFTTLPAVAIGAFIAATWSEGPAAGLILSGATVAGAICGYVLIIKLGHTRNRLRTLPQLGAFLFAGVLVMPLVSATIGWFGLKFSGMLAASDVVAVAVNWWLGDSLSVLLLVPAIFAARSLIGLGRSIVFDAGAGLLTAIQCAIAAALFLGPWFDPTPLAFLLLPVATILALRYQLASTAIANLLTFAIAGIAAHAAAFSHGTLSLHFQFVILACTTLLISVSVRQRTATLEGVQESESRFRNITELSTDWYWEQDENLRFTDISEEVPGKSGFDKDTLIGKTRFELPVTWSSELEKNAHLQTLLAREPFRDVVLRNPENRYMLVSGEPILDENGRFRGYRGVGRDVTDIKRAQQAAETSRQFFVDLINSVPSAISVKDEEHRYVEVNQAFCQMIGASREQIIGNVDEAFIEGEMCKNLQEMDRVALESDDPVSYESGFGSGDSKVWFLVRKSAMSRSAGDRVLISVFTNLTDRKRVEDALQSSELRFRDFAEAAGEYLWETDSDQRFTFVSPRVLYTLGYTPEELIGRLTSEFMTVEETARVEKWKTQNARADASYHGLEHMTVRKGGETVWLLSSGLAIRDEHGDFIGYRGTSADITTRKSNEARIHQLATRDALTELPNRVLLNDRVERAVHTCRLANRLAALLFVDLDHFKTINDSLGHPVGDALLKEVAKRLKRCVRGGDTVSRFGGDEFVVLVEQLDDARNAAQVAQKILDALAQPFDISGQVLASGCSIGIAIIPTDGEVLETLLKNADTAMYHAKERGRNNYQFFALKMTEHAVKRHKTEMELRGAVTKGQLSMHYQPQVEVASGNIVAVEALVRWQHPERGLLESASFIAVAEESGLITSIGTWVLETVCAQIKEWRAAGLPPLRVAVNISPRQTINPEAFAQIVADQLQTNGLDGSALEFEMTESPLLKHADANAILLKKLGQLGVTVAVDGFGKGSSSFAYLKQPAVNSLKIDRSFIRNIESDPEDLAIVRAIIAMARNLKLRVIAEGVETRQQLSLLKELGCQIYQGFYFARPMSAKELFDHYFANSPSSKADRAKR